MTFSEKRFNSSSRVFSSFSKEINTFLQSHNENPVLNGVTVRDLIKRNNINIFDIKNELELFEAITDEVLKYINVEVKYEGYINRENETIEKTKKVENIQLQQICNIVN